MTRETPHQPPDPAAPSAVGDAHAVWEAVAGCLGAALSAWQKATGG